MKHLDSQHCMLFFLKKRVDPQPGTSSEKLSLCLTSGSQKINAVVLDWRLQNLSLGASSISQ